MKKYIYIFLCTIILPACGASNDDKTNSSSLARGGYEYNPTESKVIESSEIQIVNSITENEMNNIEKNFKLNEARQPQLAKQITTLHKNKLLTEDELVKIAIINSDLKLISGQIHIVTQILDDKTISYNLLDSLTRTFSSTVDDLDEIVTNKTK